MDAIMQPRELDRNYFKKTYTEITTRKSTTPI